MSRRAAAARFAVSQSCAIKLVQRWKRTGSVAPAAIGAPKGTALAAHEGLVREGVAAQPDILGARVIVLDDVLATGGTAHAKIELVERLGGVVVGALFVIELSFLHGRDRLDGTDVHALIDFA